MRRELARKENNPLSSKGITGLYVNLCYQFVEPNVVMNVTGERIAAAA